MKCQEESCSAQGQERVFVYEDYALPLGPWCNSCWAIVQSRSSELVKTYDELRPEVGSNNAFHLVDQMIDREPC